MTGTLEENLIAAINRNAEIRSRFSGRIFFIKIANGAHAPYIRVSVISDGDPAESYLNQSARLYRAEIQIMVYTESAAASLRFADMIFETFETLGNSGESPFELCDPFQKTAAYVDSPELISAGFRLKLIYEKQ